MGLFGHKKKCYVFWARYDDAKDIEGGRMLVSTFGTNEVAITLKKLAGRKVKPENIRIMNDLLVNSYSKPMTREYAEDIVKEAWKIVTKKYYDEVFDKSDDVPTTAGAVDLTQVPNMGDLGIFLVFIEA